jgi:N-acetylmuramoyl-L-alanine amidase CwlA
MITQVGMWISVICTSKITTNSIMSLQYYGLKPDSAEYDAKGTVWTHYAISRYLGGTDHADPHAYLSNHNYRLIA